MLCVGVTNQLLHHAVACGEGAASACGAAPGTPASTSDVTATATATATIDLISRLLSPSASPAPMEVRIGDFTDRRCEWGLAPGGFVRALPPAQGRVDAGSSQRSATRA